MIRRAHRWRGQGLGDAGSGTVLAVALVAVLAVAVAAAAATAQVVLARQRAQAAADLGALAGAARELSTGAGCVLAAEVAAANGGRLVLCRTGPDGSVSVEVSVALRGALAGLGPVRAGATAGLPQGSSGGGRAGEHEVHQAQGAGCHGEQPGCGAGRHRTSGATPAGRTP